MIKRLFGQFTPDTIGIIPLQALSIILASRWIIFKFSKKIFPGKIKYIWKKTQSEAMKLLFQKKKKRSNPWIIMFTTIFFLLLSINIRGLLPYAFTITSHISFTYSLAIPIWLSVKILGFFLSFKARLRHLVPQGTPSYLIPLMIWIETIRLIAQPIALGLRLAANLTAGHLLIFLLSSATWVLLKKVIIASLTTIILLLLLILEIGVACVQAYVFTSLIKFYLEQKINYDSSTPFPYCRSKTLTTYSSFRSPNNDIRNNQLISH